VLGVDELANLWFCLFRRLFAFDKARGCKFSALHARREQLVCLFDIAAAAGARLRLILLLSCSRVLIRRASLSTICNLQHKQPKLVRAVCFELFHLARVLLGCDSRVFVLFADENKYFGTLHMQRVRLSCKQSNQCTQILVKI
jgi:hypothetical protein